MATPGMDEVEDILDPAVPVPEDVEPTLTDILPRGYLSISQAGMVLKCAHQWALRYIEGKTAKTVARMFQGSQVHKAVEKIQEVRLYTGALPPKDVALDVFSQAFETQKPLIEDWEGEDPGAIKDTGYNCTKIFYEDAAPKIMPVAVEKVFSTTIKTKDGKLHLPVLGYIDSIQAQAPTEDAYQNVREKVAADYAKQRVAYEAKQAKLGEKKLKVVKDRDGVPLTLPVIKSPLRVHDLKVVTDKWSPGDLDNDMQFALYAGVEHIPDVQVDQLVKGRAKVPRPRYEVLSGVITNSQVQHTVSVLEDVAKTIALGHFTKTDPSNWWCSEKWCSMWHHCRGRK